MGIGCIFGFAIHGLGFQTRIFLSISMTNCKTVPTLCWRFPLVVQHPLFLATEGHIVGEVVEESAIFRGVPFSQPPVGEFRWSSPRPPTSYKGPYWNATYSRPGCPQICKTLRKKYCCAPIVSKTCLGLHTLLCMHLKVVITIARGNV